MMLPLPRGKAAYCKDSVGKANKGLCFYKFVDQWPVNGDKFDGLEEKKKVWLEKFEGGTASGKKVAERIKSIAESMGGRVELLTLVSPLVTGMGLSHPVENGFLWHHSYGIPYIPGSSIKGAIRAWADQWEGADDKEITRLFGGDSKDSTAGAGSIVVFDAFPVETLELYVEVMTPHDGGWRIKDAKEENAPADWVNPVPIPFLAVQDGDDFQFAIAPRDGGEVQEGDVEKAYKYLTEALEWIGIGAKTAVGFGRFMTREKIEEQKQKQREREQQEKKEKEEAERNWSPSVGDVFYWDDMDDNVEVLEVLEDGFRVRGLSDGFEGEAPLGALKKEFKK